MDMIVSITKELTVEVSRNISRKSIRTFISNYLKKLCENGVLKNLKIKREQLNLIPPGFFRALNIRGWTI